MPIINRVATSRLPSQQPQEAEPVTEAAPDQINRRSGKRPYSELQRNSGSAVSGLRAPDATKQRQFLGAIRDDIQDVVVDLTREAHAAHAQAALLMDGGGRPLRIALRHGKQRPARYIWKHLSDDQRTLALTYRNGILWWNAAYGSPETVTWLLNQANLTATARDDANRPHSAGLIKALRSAMTGGHCATLAALWDRATWPEWQSAVRDSFAEAFESERVDVVQTVLRLSAPEPHRVTIEDILMPMLEEDEGLVVHAAERGRTALLNALNPFLSAHERAWLGELAKAAAPFDP